jgi:hypothetical protein
MQFIQRATCRNPPFLEEINSIELGEKVQTVQRGNNCLSCEVLENVFIDLTFSPSLVLLGGAGFQRLDVD